MSPARSLTWPCASGCFRSPRRSPAPGHAQTHMHQATGAARQSDRTGGGPFPRPAYLLLPHPEPALYGMQEASPGLALEQEERLSPPCLPEDEEQREHPRHVRPEPACLKVSRRRGLSVRARMGMSGIGVHQQQRSKTERKDRSWPTGIDEWVAYLPWRGG